MATRAQSCSASSSFSEVPLVYNKLQGHQPRGADGAQEGASPHLCVRHSASLPGRRPRPHVSALGEVASCVPLFLLSFLECLDALKWWVRVWVSGTFPGAWLLSARHGASALTWPHWRLAGVREAHSVAPFRVPLHVNGLL